VNSAARASIAYADHAMYIWRFPVHMLGCVAVVAVLLPLIAGLLEVRRRIRSVAGRGVVMSLAVVALVGSGAANDWLIGELNMTRGIDRVYIDPSPGLLLLPAGVVVLLVSLGHVLLRGDGNRKRTWRLVFYLAGFSFFVVNCIDTCSPGWCSGLGFPFTYFGWSDSMFSFNGETSSPFSEIGLGLNASVFGVACYLLRSLFTRGGRSLPSSAA
jgi:hypothetical protein